MTSDVWGWGEGKRLRKGFFMGVGLEVEGWMGIALSLLCDIH